MAQVTIYSIDQLRDRGWEITTSQINSVWLGRAYKKFYDLLEYEYSPSGMTTEDVVLQTISYWATAIEYGYEIQTLRGHENMYFPKEKLYTWISPQQLSQFEKMYPDAVRNAYQDALGLIRSQIGELYDINAILENNICDEGTVDVFRWIIIVLTAYNITGSAITRSEVLENNFRLAHNKLQEMKAGSSTLSDAPLRSEPNAWPGVVKNGSKMLG